MILPWWAKPLAALLLLAGAALSGWRAHSIYDRAEERDRLANTIISMQMDQNASREISQGLQDTLANLKMTTTTIRTETQREIIEKPVYRDVACGLPDGGRLRLDAAIDTANHAGRPDANVPGATEAGREPAR